jgi:hypothetical protein
MTVKKPKNKAGTPAVTPVKIIDSSDRCITCNRTCSMSGMCMKPWPEFDIPKEKGGRK